MSVSLSTLVVAPNAFEALYWPCFNFLHVNDAKRKKLPLKDLLCGNAAVKESLAKPLVKMLPVLNATSRLLCCGKYPQLGNP